MRFLLTFILITFSASAIAADTTSKYYVPPGQFNASVQIMSQGLANIMGLFGNATGGFMYDDNSKTLSGLKLAIDATSLVSSNSDNKTDLSNLLGISQYPEIRFTALDNATFTDNKASIKGTLTIHGASRPITVEATINSVGKMTHNSNAWAGESSELGLSLHGSFKRADFAMGDEADSQGRFGDMITLQLEMQALKQ